MIEKLTTQEVAANPILINNVQIYGRKYPNDMDRIIEIVTRKVTNPPKVTGIEIAPPSDLYKARICFMACIMSPEAWLQAIKIWKSDVYMVVEPNPDAVAHVFQTYDLTPFLTNLHFYMFLGYQGEDVIAPMQRVLRQTIYAGKLLLSQVLTPKKGEGIADEYVEYAHKFNDILRKTVDHVFFNFGHIDDSVEGLKATFQNSERIFTSGGITELENIHKDKPIVVVGAGPSLDSDINELVKYQNKCIVVAVDAAVYPLLKAGCRIDYVSTIERYNGFQEKFFEGLPPQEADLVCYPVVHRDVIKLWPGPVRLTYRNYAWYAYFERNWPLGILESGGSASHLAARLAIHLGASKIVLVGCDMTYQKHPTEDKWRSHCQHTAYAESWDKWKTEEEIRGQEEFYGFYDVEGNDGSQVKTHTIYHQWAKEYSTMIMAYGLEGRLVTTAKTGVKASKLPYIPIAEALGSGSDIDVSKKHPANSRKMSQLGHTTAVRNVEAICETIKRVFERLTELVKNPDIRAPEAVKLARDTLYGKLAYDTFFTAFFIQNCAMEFFKAEARFYAAPDPIDGNWDDEHYKVRLEGLHLIYAVFNNIGQKTLAVMKEEAKSL